MPPRTEGPGEQRLQAALEQLRKKELRLATVENAPEVGDVQVSVMAANLEMLQRLHSSLIDLRLGSCQSAADFGGRIGLHSQTVSQFEASPLESSVSTALLYMMGAGVAMQLSVDSKSSWHPGAEDALEGPVIPRHDITVPQTLRTSDTANDLARRNSRDSERLPTCS